MAIKKYNQFNPFANTCCKYNVTIGNTLSPPVSVNRIPNGGIIHGVDVRYAATYGNPHLRAATGLGFATVNTAKPASTPAPPPYSSVRSSVVIPSGEKLF